MTLSASSDQPAATAEEYWLDIEGLDHRDAVTDFGLPGGTFFDCASVHLLTTATLDRLHLMYPQGRFEVRRFRPNIVVETANGEKEFAENAWIGQIVAIGCCSPDHRSLRPLRHDDASSGRSPQRRGYPAYGGPAKPG